MAVKKMKKNEMLNKNQVGHVRAERDVLAHSNIPWIVDLIYAFKVGQARNPANSFLGRQVTIIGDGIPAGRRSDDATNEEGHPSWGGSQVLHCGAGKRKRCINKYKYHAV